MKRVVVLGSTGSIGRQALDVIGHSPDEFRVVGLSGWSNAELLLAQCREFRPEMVCVSEGAYRDFRGSPGPPGARVVSGASGLVELASMDAHLVLVGITGIAGLAPVLAAAKLGRTIALANKESIVAAGDIIEEQCKARGASIIPVDSEHSAIFQCLQSGKPGEVSRIILTASGGPFLGRSRRDLEKVSVAETLSHPNWRMGSKITVDSATLMNKGLEVIEAHHLFGVPYESIVVTVHPQSIVHSMVEFVDRSIMAQLSVPDMRIAIQYALTYPSRKPGPAERYEPWMKGPLTFSEPDTATFPLLRLAYETGKAGGAAPLVMSAANEIAVGAFLDGSIGFVDVSEIVIRVVVRSPRTCAGTLGEILEIDAWARRVSGEEVASVARRRGS